MTTTKPARTVLALLAAGLLCGGGAAAQAPASYDDTERLPVREIIPKAWRQSIHYTVAEHARLDGDFLVFELQSALGSETVRSLPLLAIRVHEITTMVATATQLEKEDVDVREAIAGHRGVGSESVVDLLTRPLQTAGQLADNLGTNLESTLAGDYLRREQTSGGKHTSLDPRLAPFKRSVAAQLNLDSYSSNPSVQGFLNQLAALRAAGELSEVLAEVSTGSDGGPLRPRSRQTARFEGLIKNNDPAKLAELQARSLRGMGIDQALVDAFLEHPAYSPRHRTYITGYLEALEGVRNRDALLESALGASGEPGALAYQAVARLMARLHEDGNPLAAFRQDDVVPTAVGTEGRVHYFLPVDYIAWNLDSAATVQALIEQSGDTPPVLAVAGRFSDRARRALRAQGVPFHEGLPFR